jgi:hypothetical protein
MKIALSKFNIFKNYLIGIVKTKFTLGKFSIPFFFATTVRSDQSLQGLPQHSLQNSKITGPFSLL